MLPGVAVAAIPVAVAVLVGLELESKTSSRLPQDPVGRMEAAETTVLRSPHVRKSPEQDAHIISSQGLQITSIIT